jgi:transcriptional regulator with XRE-family HTH domain
MLGCHLKSHRKAHRLTQQQFCKLAGIGIKTLIEIERRGNAPKAKVLAKISVATGWTQNKMMEVMKK